ncbi:MAG: hypothetical protein ACRD2N_06770 [Vicinamibacterales bacterium]
MAGPPLKPVVVQTESRLRLRVVPIATGLWSTRPTRFAGRPISILNELGVRFRDMRRGPDGFLYVLTEMRMAGNEDVDGALLRIEPADPE